MGCLKLSYYQTFSNQKVLYSDCVLEPKSAQMWLSVDPMSDERPSLTPYNYCQNNPIILIDPDGMLDSEHTDGLGNIIAHYDDGDNSVYQHKTGTTKEQIDKQRAQNHNTGGEGVKIGELGKNIDMTMIFSNKLAQSGKEASSMDIFDYFVAVKPGGKWDLKNNTSTIWGVAWQFDENSNDKDIKTTFSCSNFSGANAADVGNFHAGYTGVMAGIPVNLLLAGAGAAETYKSFSEGRTMQGVGKTLSLFNPFSTTKGDNARDCKYNQWGMKAAYDKLLKR